MTESEFLSRTDRVLRAIADALDAADVDSDWELSDGILTLDLNNGKVIINRHVPNREIWLASAVGAAHFRLDEGGAVWRDTRSSETLGDALRRMVAKQSNTIVRLETIA